jgi:hypothetical protein
MEEAVWLWLAGLGIGGAAAARNRRILRSVARGYVAVTEALGRFVEPIRVNWQEAVEEARQEREQQASQDGGSPRRTRRHQRQGERTLKKSAGVAASAATPGPV